ncbi:hypothetical protein DL96DRAFT_1772790 [Flagelloscypha sp. PMI_526]|nr:hypothetical protein DL96DRAFT_1772790 [Flagelloscypha sp. PMI_526]
MEASIDYTANIQGILNLMGFGADPAAEDPHAPYVLRKLSYYFLDGSTSHIPQTLDQFVSTVMMKLVRLLDDDRLDDRVWASEVMDVELLRMSDWALRMERRKGHVRFGFLLVGSNTLSLIWFNGHSSNLTFSLSPNWSFVPTENWRKDARGDWIEGEVDRDGWSYTNDAWLNHVEKELEGKITVTRRRRWTRRVWFDVAGVGQ